ncbi:hypothetical protein [Yersinia phage vB_Yru_GN1]|uniref:Uncharacterized protein n=1 Tax=Yersinia phage vB_Yru_GN1 TaxID=3074381 RepID=A0AA86J0L3_9CAUD|nr:hypothetical protein [Yersinia phage vB_Yru_GN1]
MSKNLDKLISGTPFIRIELENRISQSYPLYKIIDNRKSKESYNHTIGYITQQYQDSVSKDRDDVRVVAMNHRQLTSELIKDDKSPTKIYKSIHQITEALLNIDSDKMKLFDLVDDKSYFIKFVTKLGFSGYISTYNDDPKAQYSYQIVNSPISINKEVADRLIELVNKDIDKPKSYLIPVHGDSIIRIKLVEINLIDIEIDSKESMTDELSNKSLK